MTDWSDYTRLLNNQIEEAKFNLKHAEKKYRESKAIYEGLLMQQKMFEKAMDEMLEK